MGLLKQHHIYTSHYSSAINMSLVTCWNIKTRSKTFEAQLLGHWIREMFVSDDHSVIYGVNVYGEIIVLDHMGVKLRSIKNEKFNDRELNYFCVPSFSHD